MSRSKSATPKTVEVKPMMMLPPHPSKCQECAVDHPREMPHDATSLFYGMKFKMQNNRDATWADAMAHCDEAMKKKWTEILARDHGIDVNSWRVRGTK